MRTSSPRRLPISVTCGGSVVNSTASGPSAFRARSTRWRRYTLSLKGQNPYSFSICACPVAPGVLGSALVLR